MVCLSNAKLIETLVNSDVAFLPWQPFISGLRALTKVTFSQSHSGESTILTYFTEEGVGLNLLTVTQLRK